MAWTISARLTFTFSALTGTILAIVTVLSFWAIKASVEKDAIASVQHVADRVAQSIMQQLDEDLLVDFNGEAVSFQALQVESDYWAIVCQDQPIKFASDALLTTRPDGSRLIDIILTRERSKGFWVATTPLLRDTGLKAVNLPPPVLETATAATPGAAFLNAKREMSGHRNVISIKVLYDDRITEVKVSEDGELVGKKDEELVDRLMPSLLKMLPVDKRFQSVDRLSWAAYDGQLIAIIDGRLSNGQVAQVAMNRLGEQLQVNDRGEVRGKNEEATLSVVVASSTARDRHKIVTALALTVSGGIGAWIAVSLVGWFVTRKALSPVDQIVRIVGRIQLSHLEERLPKEGVDDELSRLAATINAMLDRIQAGYVREQQFVSDAAHELTGPLCKVIADIEVALSRQRGNDEYREVLQRVWRYAEELQRLVESLLLLARLDSQHVTLRFEMIDMVELLSDMVSALSPEDGQRVVVVIDDSDEAIVLGEPELIKVLLRNVIDNALHYSPPAEAVHVRIRLDDEHTEVEITDRGPGIDDEESSKVFDRFYRLDSTRTRETGGFGLGLAIVKAIASIHHAEVKFCKGMTVGTVVSVKFRNT